MDLDGLNIVVLDLETAISADDCRHCGKAEETHHSDGTCQSWEGFRAQENARQFSPLGWNNKPALGLSIGCYYAYGDEQLHFFDRHTLAETMDGFVTSGCLLVSFNGIAFDFPLMRGLLRQEADTLRLSESAADLFHSGTLVELCDRFKDLCSVSYDLLAEIWKVDPDGKFARGVNSLDAIAKANGLPGKAMTGAMAPHLWTQGRYAEVMNYCAADVAKTRWLFETVCRGQSILRGDGKPLVLPCPQGLEA